MAADLYRTLGLGKSATSAEIKSAYRKLAKKLHPDQNKDNPKAIEEFKRVTSAYDILGDEKKRKAFDAGEIDADGKPRGGFGGGGFRPEDFGRGGRQQGSPFGGSGGADDIFSDIFGAFSRGGGPRPGQGGGQSRARAQTSRKGADANYEITVSFRDAALGTEKQLALQDAKTLNVRIPAGLKDGQTIRLAGQGDAGPFGGPSGDAMVKVNVRPDEMFTRDGNDIAVTQEVDLETAVLGGRVTVPTLSGKVALNLPAGTSSGKKMRLRGKGIAPARGSAGDQLVTFMVTIPADDKALEKAITQWAKKRAKSAESV